MIDIAAFRVRIPIDGEISEGTYSRTTRGQFELRTTIRKITRVAGPKGMRNWKSCMTKGNQPNWKYAYRWRSEPKLLQCLIEVCLWKSFSASKRANQWFDNFGDIVTTNLGKVMVKVTESGVIGTFWAAKAVTTSWRAKGVKEGLLGDDYYPERVTYYFRLVRSTLQVAHQYTVSREA